MNQKPVIHGRDHRPGGADSVYAGVWHNVGAAGEPAFQNSWANVGGTDVPMRFRLIVGRLPETDETLDDGSTCLELQGAVDGGAYGTVVFTLPVRYRPAYVLYLDGRDSTGTGLMWKVDTNGDVSVEQGASPIATGAVTTAKIADGAVTSAKLATTGVTAATYGDATHVAQVTVNAEGQLTAASAVTISVAESAITLSDVTTDNVTSSAHGFAPKSPADATKFLNGAATPAYAQVKDSDLSTSDITTNNVGTTKHGFAPKAPNDATKYLDGTGAWSAPSLIGADNQTGTTYTLVLADAGLVVELNNAAAITLTIPPNSSVAFPVGTVIELWQQGAGQVTVAPGAGVTIRSPGSKVKLSAQYASATLRKRATDEWALEGNLA